MFQQRFAAVLPLVFITAVAHALPQESDFRLINNIPQPTGTGIVGCSVPDGRYLLWDGDKVFLQRDPGSGIFDIIATGYAGDPAFAVLSPAGDYVLLGQGFGDGVNANLYQFDFENPVDFQSGDELQVPSHFAGAFLDTDLVALDRGDFGSPAEIVVLDLTTLTRDGTQRAFTVLRAPESTAPRDTIITKPTGSFSASVTVDGATCYVADSGNGQYKSFSVAAMINAFNTSGTLAWASGTDIGTAFQYPLGGVSGVTGSGNLVMAGFGSIVEVNPGTGNIVTTFDPADTGPFYGMIYNNTTEDFIAIEFPPTFGDPLIYYATLDGVASLPASDEWMMTLLAASLAMTAVCIGFANKART